MIVTDGGDTTSHTDFQRAVETAQLADAVIHPCWWPRSPMRPGRNVGGENALTTLSQRTGGRVFQASSARRSIRPSIRFFAIFGRNI